MVTPRRGAPFEGRYHASTPAPVVYRVQAPADQLRFRNALTDAPVSPSPVNGISRCPVDALTSDFGPRRICEEFDKAEFDVEQLTPRCCPFVGMQPVSQYVVDRAKKR